MSSKSFNQNLEEFLSQHPDVRTFEALLPDINGVLRGKWLPREAMPKISRGGLKLPLTTLAFDVWGDDVASLVFDEGDRDGICLPAGSQISRVPWAKTPTAQFMISLNVDANTAYTGDPRHVLRSVLARYSKLGLTPVVATELEFYLLQQQRDHQGIPTIPGANIDGRRVPGGQTYGIDAMRDQADLLQGIYNTSEIQQLPVDTIIKEASPSQYEVNLNHLPNAEQAADDAVLLKRVIKAVARDNQLRASFMAKPFGELAGNGFHTHFSIIDVDGNNIFDNGKLEGTEQLRHAIAGLQLTMAETMAIYAPNINSYRRFQTGSFAPMSAQWGYDNRTTALRIPASDPVATRIEHRVAGADANPYLSLAAILAGALHGLENKLTADEAVRGNAYKLQSRPLPINWPEAVQSFAESGFVREYLGAEIQRIYSASKQQEMAAFKRQVTTLEYDSYLDAI
ncbi:MAG: glutamine synthetase [Proteobacteria bacterium]|nr:glutamine synthetase [Pseudomonadota bacterium]